MKSLFRLVVALGLLFAPTAFAQTASVVGTNVIDNTGGKIATGQWCLGSTCFAVTNGLIQPGSTIALNTTGTVTVSSAGTTVLTVPGVIVGRAIFNWNTYVVTSGAAIVTLGKPLIPCSVGATATQSDSTAKWVCTYQGTTSVWAMTSTGQGASGTYAGVGAPTFACTSPCIYIRTDAATNGAFYALQAASGTSSTNWILQAQGPAGPTGTAGSNGVASLSALALTTSRLPLGRNFLDPSKLVSGYYDGGGNFNAGGYATTGHIAANAGGTMTCNKAILQYNFWDQSDAFIVTVTGGVAASTSITVPATAASVTLTFQNNGDAPTAMVVWGGAANLPTTYQAFTAVGTGDLATAVTGVNNATLHTLALDVSRLPISGGNLLDPSKLVSGYYDRGGNFNAGGYYTTGRIVANPGGTMTCSTAVLQYNFWDQSDAFIVTVTGGVAASTPISIPVNAASVTFTFIAASDFNNGMVVWGGAANLPTTYQAFAPVTSSAVAAATATAVSTAGVQLGLATNLLAGDGYRNVYDYTAATTYGVLSADGTVNHTYDPSYLLTNRMYVAGQSYVTFNIATPGQASNVVFFDISGKVLQATNSTLTGTTTMAVPAGAITLQFAFFTNQLSSSQMVVYGQTLPSYLVPYSGASRARPWVGLTPLIVGDSIVAQNYWQPVMAAYLGMSYSGTVDPVFNSNYALNGAYSSTVSYTAGNTVYEGSTYYTALASVTGVDPVSDNGTHWIDTNASAQTNGYSGHYISDDYYAQNTRLAANPSGPTLLQQLTDALSNKSVFILEGGTNDAGNPLGTFGDAPVVPTCTPTACSSTTSEYGTLEYIMQNAVKAVLATGRYIPIVYITPYWQDRLNTATSPTIYQLTTAIHQVAAEWGIYVVDQLQTTQINPLNWSRTVFTESTCGPAPNPSCHVHINSVGGQIMGMNVARQLMNVVQTF